MRNRLRIMWELSGNEFHDLLGTFTSGYYFRCTVIGSGWLWDGEDGEDRDDVDGSTRDPMRALRVKRNSLAGD